MTVVIVTAVKGEVSQSSIKSKKGVWVWLVETNKLMTFIRETTVRVQSVKPKEIIELF